MTPSTPSHERIGSIRQDIYQEDAYLIERVNAGMGEWEYVIQYCGEYYATAPTENIARDIVERAQWSRPAPSSAPEYTLEEVIKIDKQIRHAQQVAAAQARNQTLGELEILINDEMKPLTKKPTMNNREVAFRWVLRKIESLRHEVRQQEEPR